MNGPFCLLFLLMSSSLRLMRFATPGGRAVRSLSGRLNRWSNWQLKSCCDKQKGKERKHWDKKWGISIWIDPMQCPYRTPSFNIQSIPYRKSKPGTTTFFCHTYIPTLSIENNTYGPWGHVWFRYKMTSVTNIVWDFVGLIHVCLMNWLKDVLPKWKFCH